MTKVAVVTGGTRGIGYAISKRLKEDGYKVVGLYGGNTEAAQKCEGEIGIKTYQCDVSNADQCREVLAKIEDEVGPVDVLVNNAGTIMRNDALDFTEEEWDTVMDVNLKILFFLCQAFARKWVEAGAGGKIINIASMLSYQGGIRVASYTASKSGVMGLTRLLAN